MKSKVMLTAVIGCALILIGCSGTTTVVALPSASPSMSTESSTFATSTPAATPQRSSTPTMPAPRPTATPSPIVQEVPAPDESSAPPNSHAANAAFNFYATDVANWQEYPDAAAYAMTRRNKDNALVVQRSDVNSNYIWVYTLEENDVFHQLKTTEPVPDRAHPYPKQQLRSLVETGFSVSPEISGSNNYWLGTNPAPYFHDLAGGTDFPFSHLSEVANWEFSPSDDQIAISELQNARGGKYIFVIHDQQMFYCQLDDPAQEWKEQKPLPKQLNYVSLHQIETAKDLSTGKWWVYVQGVAGGEQWGYTLYRIAEDDIGK